MAKAAPVGERDWEAEDDMRTLERAHEVRSDPNRHAKAKMCASRKMTTLRAVAGRGPRAAK